VSRASSPPAVAAASPDHQGVNLLPASVYAAQDARRLRRRLVGGLVALVVLLAAGHTWLLGLEREAQGELRLAQDETSRLQAERERFAEAAEVRDALARAVQARTLGMGFEVRWVDLIRQIEAVAPPGAVITSFSAGGSNPADRTVAVAPDPLGTDGVAAIAFEVASDTLPDTAAWLEALEAIPGLMDARFSSARLADLDGASSYTVTSTVQVNVHGLSGVHLPDEGGAA